MFVPHVKWYGMVWYLARQGASLTQNNIINKMLDHLGGPWRKYESGRSPVRRFTTPDG